MILATDAYNDFLTNQRIQEAFAKFCPVCIDKEASKHACFEHPKANKSMRWML